MEVTLQWDKDAFLKHDLRCDPVSWKHMSRVFVTRWKDNLYFFLRAKDSMPTVIGGKTTVMSSEEADKIVMCSM